MNITDVEVWYRIAICKINKEESLCIFIWQYQSYSPSIVYLYMYNACVHTCDIIDPFPCSKILSAAFIGRVAKITTL